MIDIINTIIGLCPNNDDPGDSPTINSSVILGTCMHILATRDIEEWSGLIDVGTWTAQAVRKWAWSSDVLSGLLALAHARFEYSLNYIGRKKLTICVYCIHSPLHLTPVSLHAIYPSLSCSILSPSRSLRLNALRLLDFKKLIDKNHQDPDADGVMEVLKRCIQGEEVSLDLQGVRERVLRIGRVGQVVGDVRGAEVCARWLIGLCNEFHRYFGSILIQPNKTAQLKVNLRPLWSPAATALASLSQRFGDVVWKLLFEEVQKFTCVTSSSIQPEVAESERNFVASNEDKENADDQWEEERSWRDPSAHNLRSVIVDWDNIQSMRTVRISFILMCVFNMELT